MFIAATDVNIDFTEVWFSGNTRMSETCSGHIGQYVLQHERESRLKTQFLFGKVLLLAIISATYFIFFAQPTTKIFIDHVVETRTKIISLSSKVPEEAINILTHEKLFTEDNVSPKDRDEIATNLLENGKKTFPQTKESLMKQLQLLKKERRLEKARIDNLSKHFEKQKKIFEANITVNQEFFKYASLVLRNTSYPGVENYTRYAVARLGLLPLINVKALKPEFGPVINDVLSFRYPITIGPCLDVITVDGKVFVAVVSAPGNFEKRKIIRQTWKIHLKTEYDNGLLGIAGFGFMLGLTTSDLMQAQIEEESKMYGDIIQIGVSDFYRNLSLKVAGIFNWLYRNCNKVDFIFKIDDDVYVNVRNLAHFVQQLNHQSNPSMFGLPSKYLSPNRDGKWSITYEEWPWSHYPTYYLGPAVLITGSAIHLLLAAFQTTPMMPFDDVYYTGICREKAGIKLHYVSKSASVLVMKQPELPVACDLRHFIAWLTASGNHMFNSHTATDDFYQSRAQCVVTDSNGISSTIGHSEAVHFDFY